jgi:hypothetical protein
MTQPKSGFKYSSEKDNLEIIRRLVNAIKESITSTPPGTGATLSEQQAQTALLQQIENNTDGLEVQLVLSKDSGVVDADTLRVVLEDLTRDNISNILAYTQQIASHVEFGNWESIPGNRLEYTYINGTLNPADLLVETISYYKAASLTAIKTFTYNPDDTLSSVEMN